METHIAKIEAIRPYGRTLAHCGDYYSPPPNRKRKILLKITGSFAALVGTKLALKESQRAKDKGGTGYEKDFKRSRGSWRIGAS
jgi:hypothetical protein